MKIKAPYVHGTSTFSITKSDNGYYSFSYSSEYFNHSVNLLRKSDLENLSYLLTKYLKDVVDA